MKRRWVGVFLMAWAIIAPLFAFPIPAMAAGETYTFTKAPGVVIIGTGFTGVPLGVNFKPTGSTYTGTGVANFGSPAPTFVISGLTKNTTIGGYNATIKTTPASFFPQPTAAIHIDDPNSLGPGGGSPPITPTPTPAAGGAAAGAAAVTCDAGPAFSWLICGAVETMVKTVDTIRDSVIVPFLKEPPFDKNQPEFKSAYNIWSAFRNVASIFFILVFFLVIIGTALGFDNYTIKKVLPHLVAGAILVPFSWYLCAFVIDIGNVVGQGLVALMSGIIPTPKIDLTSSFDAILVTGTAGVVGFVLAGAAVAGIGLPLVFSLLIAFAGVFLTLIFRKIMILLMVVMSPFALLAWVLPNTEKWFREWWQNFFKLVMMYPLIMLLFEAGRLFSATAGAANGATGTPWITQLFAISGLILPLFLVPWTFKFAGKGLAMGSGAIGKLTGSADKRYGKDSAFAKDMAEGRARKNFETSNKAKDASKTATGLNQLRLKAKANYNMRRSGLSGPGGSAELRRQAAAPKIDSELSALEGAKRTAKELDTETWDQRRAATTQKFVDDRAKTRAGRQGVMDAYEAGGRPVGSTTQAAERIRVRDNYLAGIGGDQGTIEDDQLNERDRINNPASYVGPATRVAAARDTAALQSSEARGAAKGVVQGGIEAEGIIRDQAGVGAADARDLRLRTVGQAKTNTQITATVTAQQNANTNVTANMELDQKQITEGHATTLEEARSMRLKNLAASTHTQEREKLGLAEGQIDEQNSLTHAAGQESMGGLVAGGQLAARKQLTSARSQRTAAYQSVQDGTAATTSESLDAATYQAGRATRKADSDIKGVAGTVNAAIDTQTRELQERAKASGITVSDSVARAQAAGVVRAKQLGAVGQVERANAEVRTASEINTDIGGAKTLNAEISAETGRVKVAARADGKTLTQAEARSKAEANVRARQISAASDVAESQGSVKLAAEREQVRGVQDSLQSQEVEEAARIQALPGNTLTPEQAATQAKTNVAQNNIKNAGTVFRQKAARDDKEATAATAGTAGELKAEVAREARLSKVGTQAAARNVRARDLKNTGVNAADASLRKASADRGTSIGTSRGIEAEIQGEVDTLQEAATAAGTALPPSLALSRATATVQARNINTASRAAQINAQESRIQAPRKDQGTIKAYEAAIENATKAPLNQKRDEAYKIAYEATKATAGQAAYDTALAHQKTVQKKLQDAAAAAGEPRKSDADADRDAKAIAEQAMKEQGEAAGDAAGKAAALSIKATSVAPLDRADAEKNVINSIGVQAEEQSMRAEATSLGTTAAFNQAVNGTDALNAEKRLAAQTETAVASLASESAGVRARYNLTSPGKPLNRTYEAAESSASKLEEEKILDVRTNEALREPITYRTYEVDKTTGQPKLNPDGTPETITVSALKDAELSNEALQGMRDEVIALSKNPDDPHTDRVIALMNQLGKSGPGQEELRYLKREIFGGDDNNTVDMTRFNNQAKMIWDKGISTVPRGSAPDLHIPQIAINDGVSAEAFADMNWRAKRDYIDYVTNPKRGNPKDKQRLMQEASDAIVGAINNPKLSGKLDSDAYKVMIGFFKQPVMAKDDPKMVAKGYFDPASHNYGQKLDEEEITSYDRARDNTDAKQILESATYEGVENAGAEAIRIIEDRVNRREGPPPTPPPTPPPAP